MKKPILLLALLITLVASSWPHPAAAAPAVAVDPASVPGIVSKGFDAYKTSNAAAIDAWFKDSPMENNVQLRVTVATQLNNIEKANGKFLGWETVKVVPLTQSTEMVYVVAKFEKAPLWFAFECYKATDHWTLPSIRLDENVYNILPVTILGGN